MMNALYSIIVDLGLIAPPLLAFIMILVIATRRTGKERDRWLRWLAIYWPLVFCSALITASVSDGNASGLKMMLPILGFCLLIWYLMLFGGGRKCESCGHGPFKQKVFNKICPHCGEPMKQK